MDVSDNESWYNNNNKDQENGKYMRDMTLDDGGIMVNPDQLDGGDTAYGPFYCGEYLMDTARFNCDWVDCGYLLDWDWSLIDTFYVQING